MAQAHIRGDAGDRNLTDSEKVERYLEEARRAEEEDIYIALSKTKKALDLVGKTEGKNSSKYKEIRSYKKKLEHKASDDDEDDDGSHNQTVPIYQPGSTTGFPSLRSTNQPVSGFYSTEDLSTDYSNGQLSSLHFSTMHSGPPRAPLVQLVGIAEHDSTSQLKENAPRSLRLPFSQSGLTSRSSQTDLEDMAGASSSFEGPGSHADRLHAMTKTPLSLTQGGPESVDGPESSGKFHTLMSNPERLTTSLPTKPDETDLELATELSNIEIKENQLEPTLSVNAPVERDVNPRASHSLVLQLETSEPYSVSDLKLRELARENQQPQNKSSGHPIQTTNEDGIAAAIAVQAQSEVASPLRQIPPSGHREQHAHLANERTQPNAARVPQIVQHTPSPVNHQAVAGSAAHTEMQSSTGRLFRTFSYSSERALSSAALLASNLGRPPALPAAILEKPETSPIEGGKDLVQGHIDLGRAYHKSSPADSATHYEKAFELMDILPELQLPEEELLPDYKNNALAHLRSGDVEAAMVYCEKAESLCTTPRDLAEIQEIAAQVHDEAGRVEEAARCRSVAAENRQQCM